MRRHITRDQLRLLLLKEKPWLRITSFEFREALVIRGIYVVGHNPSILANYLGMRRQYVLNICVKHRTEALKAARDFLQGTDYQVTVAEQLKGILKTVQRKIQRRSILSSLRKRFGQMATKHA